MSQHDKAHDPVEALHQAGLLLTPAREQAIRASGVEFVLVEMRRWRPVEFLRLSGSLNLSAATPADLLICILKWLEAHLSVAKGNQP